MLSSNCLFHMRPCEVLSQIGAPSRIARFLSFASFNVHLCESRAQLDGFAKQTNKAI